MTNKEFINRLIRESGMPSKEVNELTSTLLGEIEKRLVDEDFIVIPEFGTFEVKKKLERVVVNPVTKQKMLIPPKMVVTFKPSGSLKQKINA
ncbi:MAG: HU family DNA-binding protein [Bacteroidaceae bacterium]|jgi:nucleoid DNA-binding protein|nr:HU family DNA-binding protein [Bacteroidaceae bacterium]MBQ2341743.1 HU family DNA-binding protein [Bacteroidaceae bacterium]MBQ6050062.1 HU family DNA-binding protein [Bacteroidaceae bacterium]MBQ6085835.1 HU family DNA-binding protein [Bacteroidaceae bacterium]MBR3546079.1 HU family DNA-binding protein [Bacteroidaceae bacterium]